MLECSLELMNFRMIPRFMNADEFDRKFDRAKR